MTTVIRICDHNSNKYSGFELCKNENITKIFEHGVYEGLDFKIGVYKYTVTKVYVDGFYNGTSGRDTLDGRCSDMGTHLWVCCKTDDPRIQEGNINESTELSLSEDLGLV